MRGPNPESAKILDSENDEAIAQQFETAETSSVKDDVAMRSTLAQNVAHSSHEQNATAALLNDFTSVIELNRASEDVAVLRLSAGLGEILPKKDLERVDYRQMLKDVVGACVSPADRERLQTAFAPKYLFSRLEESSTLIERFNIERGGYSYAYYGKISRVPDTPDFTDVIMGFAPATIYRYESDKPTVHTGAKIHHRHCVLIVEDNELNSSMLAALLEDDYDTMIADNGEEGLRVLAENYKKIDCVLLDVNMPICDGYEFLERARNDEILSQIPVIVTTANNTLQDELRCLELGAFDFVAKPYEADIVKARLRGIINLHESIDTLSAVEFDELTNTYTRQAFFLHARALISANPGKEIVAFAAKFENNSIISTVYGRKAGNKVLTYLGLRFLNLSDNGVVCHYDSDRFVAIKAFDEAFDDNLFAEGIESIAAKAPVPGVEIKYGVYLDVDTSLHIEDICDRAFAALQAVEADSTRSVGYFAGKAHLKMEEEQKLEAAFEDALANNEFVVYFQPKCSAQTGEVCAAEALVRWKMSVDENGTHAVNLAHAKDTKMISPGAFIPLFERNGMIAKLDRFMFSQVCHIQSERISAGQKVVPISINLSRINLYRHDIVETYVNIAKEAGVPFNLVPIELTESVAVSDTQVSEAINGLAAAGFPIQLDDFGSGYSSYASLASLPLSTIKIDKSLMDKYGDRAGRIVISSSISLAKALKMEVVSEGVETSDQVKFLRGTACDLIQGYYFSAPVPYERFSEMVEAGHV